jgi:hypothetical protein
MGHLIRVVSAPPPLNLRWILTKAFLAGGAAMRGASVMWVLAALETLGVNTDSIKTAAMNNDLLGSVIIFAFVSGELLIFILIAFPSAATSVCKKSQHLRHSSHTINSPSVLLLTARIFGCKRDASMKFNFVCRET